jgi:hypothetical protein
MNRATPLSSEIICVMSTTKTPFETLLKIALRISHAASEPFSGS